MNVNQDSPEIDQTSRRLDTQTRREQITLTALKLVDEEGLEKLSIAGIAKEIGLVPSAIYRHFNGKDQIVDAVSDLIRERLLGNVRYVCNETSDPIKRLRLLLERHIALIKTDAGIPRFVFSAETFKGGPERKERLYQTVRLYLEKIGDIIREGQLKGRIRRDIDTEALSVMFLGLIQPAVFLRQLSDGQFDVEKQAESAWGIFKESIERDAS